MRIRGVLRGGWHRLGIIVVVALCALACEESFVPELDDFDGVLVVDGAITTAPGPYTVTLSFSSGIYASDQRAVEGATVTLIEQGGEQETFTENEPGQYMTSPDGMRGTTGKSYKLSIQLQDGSLYESDFQSMPAAIGIDTVEADLEYRFLNLDETNVPGFQFYVTSERSEKPDNYFIWLLESTYKYRSAYTIDFVYTLQGVQPYPNPSEFMTCWRTDRVNEIYSLNTEFLSEAVVERLPLNFVRADERELSIRYSLLAKQLTISEEAYNYWNKLQRQVENQESLYNSQPFQISGNIFNIDNPDETVLGFFMVAAQDEQRIYVDHPTELGLEFSYCGLDYMSYAFLGLFPSEILPIYIHEDAAGDRALSNDECFDCRKLGGTIEQPAFWED